VLCRFKGGESNAKSRVTLVEKVAFTWLAEMVVLIYSVKIKIFPSSVVLDSTRRLCFICLNYDECMTLLPREIWNSTIKYLVKMVEAPAYIINNDISLMLLVRSNLKTVLCIFDYDEIKCKEPHIYISNIRCKNCIYLVCHRVKI
jgi:hypothetical protein